MRPVIIKAYGGFSPASDETLEAVQGVLRDTHGRAFAELDCVYIAS